MYFSLRCIFYYTETELYWFLHGQQQKYLFGLLLLLWKVLLCLKLQATYYLLHDIFSRLRRQAAVHDRS